MSTLPTPLRWLLLGSLCLNLLLGVALAGLMWRQPDAAGVEEVAGRSLPDARRIERALPPERRALVRETLRGDRAELMSTVRALRAAHAEARRALAAPDFDADALSAALAEVRAREQATAERVHAGLQRMAGQLSAEERARVAEHLRSRHGRSRHRGEAGAERHP
jgi:uncharacterized membrane protein